MSGPFGNPFIFSQGRAPLTSVSVLIVAGGGGGGSTAGTGANNAGGENSLTRSIHHECNF